MIKLGQSLANVGSRATGIATAKADNIGAAAKSISARDGLVPKTPMRVKKMIHPGSSAGLRNEKSVHLQMNGTGWTNPAHHKARNNPKQPLTKPHLTNSNTSGFIRASQTYDTRPMKSCKGSICLMKDRFV